MLKPTLQNSLLAADPAVISVQCSLCDSKHSSEEEFGAHLREACPNVTLFCPFCATRIPRKEFLTWAHPCYDQLQLKQFEVAEKYHDLLKSRSDWNKCGEHKAKMMGTGATVCSVCSVKANTYRCLTCDTLDEVCEFCLRSQELCEPHYPEIDFD